MASSRSTSSDDLEIVIAVSPVGIISNDADFPGRFEMTHIPSNSEDLNSLGINAAKKIPELRILINVSESRCTGHRQLSPSYFSKGLASSAIVIHEELVQLVQHRWTLVWIQ